ITNGTENSVVLLTSTEKSGEPRLLLLLHYHGNTTLIWKTYFGTAPIAEAGEPSRGTPWRERSEANCLTSGCKSRRRRSPCGAVVISGSLRGDSWAGSPDVQAP